MIQNDPNKWVHYEAIWALQTSPNDDRYFPTLHQILKTETDRDLRGATHALLYHRDPHYRTAFIAMIRAKYQTMTSFEGINESI